jgi:hypothetical protein
MATVQVAINELGRRIGQDHHRAKLTNGEVEMLIQMHEEGIGYRRLAIMFDVSPSAVRYIVKGRIRAQYPTEFRVVHIRD